MFLGSTAAYFYGRGDHDEDLPFAKAPHRRNSAPKSGNYATWRMGAAPIEIANGRLRQLLAYNRPPNCIDANVKRLLISTARQGGAAQL